MKIINHMNTEVFTWKPSDWGENHGSFTKLYQSQRWLGQQPLTIYFTSLLLEGEQKLRFIQSLPDYNQKGLQPLYAYNVGPNTTLPPYYDQKKRRRRKHYHGLSNLTDID